MPSLEKKNVGSPDETRKFDNGQAEIVNIGDGTVGRFTFKPGWKWSQDVKPIAKTEWCQAPHFAYQVSGTLHVKMQDGSEYDIGPGDVAKIAAGHDAWVVGNDAVVTIDWAGAGNYAKS